MKQSNKAKPTTNTHDVNTIAGPVSSALASLASFCWKNKTTLLLYLALMSQNTVEAGNNYDMSSLRKLDCDEGFWGIAIPGGEDGGTFSVKGDDGKYYPWIRTYTANEVREEPQVNICLQNLNRNGHVYSSFHALIKNSIFEPGINRRHAVSEQEVETTASYSINKMEL